MSSDYILDFKKRLGYSYFMSSKKRKHKFVHFSPFDKELFDHDYLKQLSGEDKDWLLQYSMENINGMIIKDKSSVFNNVNARKSRLKEIKADAELYQEFLDAKKKFDKKNSCKTTELVFVQTFWQQEANRYKHRRRNDAYSTLINRKFENIKTEYVNPSYKSDEFVLKEEEDKEQFLTDAHQNNEEHADVQEFIFYRKQDRVDKYIWLKIGEVINLEKEKNKHFEMMATDIKDRNENFEAKKFPRTKYMIYLYSCLVICETFAVHPESLIINNELRNIFDLLIYPRSAKDNKLQNEK